MRGFFKYFTKIYNYKLLYMKKYCIIYFIMRFYVPLARNQIRKLLINRKESIWDSVKSYSEPTVHDRSRK